jgi:hypothetical protein
MPFCAGDISADKKGIRCFEPSITAGQKNTDRLHGQEACLYFISAPIFKTG